LRGNDGVQIEHAAVKTSRESFSDGRLSAAHEADDNDAKILHPWERGRPRAQRHRRSFKS
jgi:hypothetical protein